MFIKQKNEDNYEGWKQNPCIFFESINWKIYKWKNRPIKKRKILGTDKKYLPEKKNYIKTKSTKKMTMTYLMRNAYYKILKYQRNIPIWHSIRKYHKIKSNKN